MTGAFRLLLLLSLIPIGGLSETTFRQPLAAAAPTVTWREDPAHDGVIVTIGNPRAVALEAWKVSITYSTATVPESNIEYSQDTYLGLALPFVPPEESRPIPPRASRGLKVPLPAVLAVKSGRLIVALFSDSS